MIHLENSKHSRKVHITEVTIAVLLATIPYVIFAARSEFHISLLPGVNCGAGPVHSFYGLIMPTVLVYCSSLIMMLFVLYKIHLVSC